MSTKLQVHGLSTPWRAVAIAAAVCALILGSIVMVVMTLSELGNAPTLMNQQTIRLSLDGNQ